MAEGRTMPSTKNESIASGIPRGNTVAVVGDPGTGKTTFLLTYVTHGKAETCQGKERDPDGGAQWQWVVRLASKKKKRPQVEPSAKEAEQDSEGNQSSGDDEEKPAAGGPAQNVAFEAIDRLFSPACSREAPVPTEARATLRCFVSLENNLRRVLANHGNLLKGWPPGAEHDELVVIDATSFLSGRLEDRLRYPRLRDASSESHLPDDWRGSYDLTLGGHKPDEDEHFGLYYQALNEDPKRIEQLEDKAAPFEVARKERRRAFNLITPPLPDPLQRVRLLKDLLAEVFVRFRECRHRLLAIDSLSALINPFGQEDVSASASPARRLNILNLVRWLEEHDVTTFLACEAEHDNNRSWGGRPLFLGTQERYLASGVLQLDYHTYPSGDIVRYLRVLKMRGAAHDMRRHAYDLGEDGIAWVEPLFGEAGKES